MKTYTKEELKDILDKLKPLFEGNGERANLADANLSRADLSGADLSDANLSGADLSDANLSGANLYCAKLSGAKLSGANLSGANLYCANLYCADLSGAKLSGANLYCANLSCANLININLSQFLIVPETGSFIGYKKSKEGIIIKLEIQENSLRLNALSSRKCRAQQVKILKFINSKKRILHSSYDKKFTYKIGQIITVDNFDTDITKECSSGIHFFITKKEAEDYNL